MSKSDEHDALRILPATRREVTGDIARVLAFDAAAMALVLLIAGLVAPWFGFARALAVIGGVLILLYPLVLAWRRLVVPRLQTRGATRQLLATLCHAGMLLLLPVVATILGLGGGGGIAMSIAGPIGFGLLFMGWQLRHGDSLHCPKCGHEIPPVEPRPTQCLECGVELGADLGAAIKGARRPSTVVMSIGALLVAAWIGPTILGAVGLGSAAARWTPTPVLLWHLGSQPAFAESPDTWGELGRRTLTMAQADSLMTTLLDRRLRDGRTGFQSLAWMESTLATNACSSLLAERYYRETFEPRIEAPSRVAASEPFEWELTGELRMKPSATLWAHAHVERIEVEALSEALPIRADQRHPWTYALYLESRDYRDSPGATPPSGEVPGLPPGRHVLRATVLVAISPAGATPPAPSSLVEGAPPPPPSVWWKRVVIEHPIEVTAGTDPRR